MAPHLTSAEQDRILVAQASRKSTAQMYDLLARQRQKRGEKMVHINVIRCFLRGRTHRRSKVETRGRKRSLSRRNVLAMDAARRKIINDMKGGHQVKWQEIVAKGRAPRAHATTVARVFEREGLTVKPRRSRGKPQRTPAMERERMDLCGRMRRWPLTRFAETIDMLIDNKNGRSRRRPKPGCTRPSRTSSHSSARQPRASIPISRSPARGCTARTWVEWCPSALAYPIAGS